ncbi:MAG TPA: dihydrodipicolinate synthase family protein [Terriglobia bacterium]|jgi:4-hydroxy-tetrahydrodipicolinate synthase|nr:dihydrodipicolinate synthase family protein [Terriglobia bacterium]
MEKEYRKNRGAFVIHGIVPIVPTPFRENEEVDWDGLRALVDFACVSGACALCLLAYASEFYKLSEGERRRAIAEAVDQAAGRIPVIGQVNAWSAKLAAETALDAQHAGVDAVSVSVPRLFPLAERDILRYFDRILSAIDIPLLVQDFNPGGPTLSVELIADLHGTHPHFRYIKLEEPLMASKVEAIVEKTSGEIGVLEGWGGMFMLELIPAGICGVMPSLGAVDLLARVFHLAEKGQKDEAYRIFQCVLPQILFSLQNLEFLHHVEKSLLVERGILSNAGVREATLELNSYDRQHIIFLNNKILEELDRLHLPRNPCGSGKMQQA